MTDAPTTPDPIEIAMEAAARGAGFDSPAWRLLVRQEQLVAADLKHRRWQIAGERMSTLLKGLGVAAALVVAAGLGALAWQASRAKGVVIEAFSVPPDFAAAGLTGEVVAAQVQDKLAELERKTLSARASATYANDWGRDIKVQIPQTGVSIGEVQRYLRQWLGHETHVTGEVFRTDGALKLTIRAKGASAEAVAGQDAGLDDLLEQGALALYRQTQPIRWVRYVTHAGALTPATKPVVEQLASTGPASERAWAINLLQADAPTLAESEVLIERGLALSPQNALLVSNFANDELELGHWEESLRYYKRLLDVVRRRDRGGITAEAAAYNEADAKMSIAGAPGDYGAALAEAGAFADISPSSDAYPRQRSAQALARLHRIAEARAAWSVDDPGALLAKTFDVRGVIYDGDVARSAGDWPRSYRDFATIYALFRAPPPQVPKPKTMLEEAPVFGGAGAALALAHLGRIGEAEAIAHSLPGDCYVCLISRGDVAYLAGRAAEGDRWFAEALRQAPSYVEAPTAWARARLDRGDVAGAIAAAKIAQRIGPKYADPVEMWGEALLMKGDTAGAARKFEAAEKLAPKWGRLHLRWGEALAKQGRADEARAQWRAAAALDLTAAERAELARVNR